MTIRWACRSLVASLLAGFLISSVPSVAEAKKKRSAAQKQRDKNQAKALKKKASCVSFAEVTSAVYDSPAGKAGMQALQKAAPYGTIAATVIQSMDAGIKVWNAAANNSAATIGPRKLEFIPEGQTGKLIGVTERVFISPTPLGGRVELDFYRTGGKGWAKVGVCIVPPGKTLPKHIKTFLIEEDTKKGKFKSVVLKANWKDPKKNARLIKVVLHGKQAVQNVEYKIVARTYDVGGKLVKIQTKISPPKGDVKSCQSKWQAASKIWERMGPAVIDAATTVAAAAAGADGKQVKQAIAFVDTAVKEGSKAYGKIVGDSKMKVGPRQLNHKWRDGAVMNQRAFVSNLLNRDDMTLELVGLGGLAKKANVSICTFDGTTYRRVKKLSLKKSDFKKKHKIKIKGSFGKTVSVLLTKKKGLPTDAFKYKLRLHGGKKPR